MQFSMWVTTKVRLNIFFLPKVGLFDVFKQEIYDIDF